MYKGSFVLFLLLSSGPSPGPRSGTGQVPGLLQVRSSSSKDNGRPDPGLFTTFILPFTKVKTWHNETFEGGHKVEIDFTVVLVEGVVRVDEIRRPSCGCKSSLRYEFGLVHSCLL